MQLKDLFEKWNLTGLKINTAFLTMEWKPGDADKDAAWELYVELLTRVSTQSLDYGREAAALESIYTLFPTTRDVLKRHGRQCVTFSKVAVVMLNQVIRPFTAKWHKRGDNTAFSDVATCAEFRKDLVNLQDKLRAYSHMLADIAGVEDITDLEAQ